MFLKSENHGFTGLVNMGNTCYMNSVLQVLFNNMKMTEYYHKFKLSDKNNEKTKNLFKNYAILMQEYWKNNSILKPISFKNSVNYYLKKYNNKQQHDAHEFFLDLINIIHDNSSLKNTEFDSENVSRHYIASKKEWRNTFKKTSSFITKEFYGQFIIKYKCNMCSNKFYKYDVFSSIYLDIGGNTSNASINTMLKRHFDSDYFSLSCQGECGENVIVEHKICKKIFKLPKVIVLVIKRYDERGIKKHTDISIPETIDLEDYYRTNKQDIVKYSLSAVVQNDGSSLNTGHYYSVVKRNDKYFTYNDHVVAPTSFENINGKHSYMLFYTCNKS